MWADRGVDVTHETVRCWANKFGPAIAANLRRARPQGHSKWHLDEMVARIGGKRMYMWPAVGAEGEVLDMLLQKRRNKSAALKLLRRLLRNQAYVPEVIVTDGQPADRAALKILGAKFVTAQVGCGVFPAVKR